MQKIISNEQPFQVLAHSFSIGFSTSGYTLAYSADGVDYSEWEESTPANETCFVVNVPKNAYFKLVGNSGEVTITY